MDFIKDFSLKDLNTFGIDVKARLMASVTSSSELQEVLLSPEFQEMPNLILGGGSNILFTGDFEGLVAKVDLEGIEKVNEDDQHVWIKGQAGENWHQFVLYCIENEWGGIENLSLIPGTLGAAPMQNVGAYGVEIKEVFYELEAVNAQTGELGKFKAADCEFGYRTSVFKTNLKDKYVVTSVTLRLDKEHKFRTDYRGVKEALETMDEGTLSIRKISNAIIKIRQAKLPDPQEIGNAGSFFKNPVVELIDFEGLKAEFEKIPGYELPEDHVKIPAAWLIDQCGWKGYTKSGIGVHKNQALVLVNHGGGLGSDIKNLAEEIKKSVAEKFGIILDPEVNII